MSYQYCFMRCLYFFFFSFLFTDASTIAQTRKKTFYISGMMRPLWLNSQNDTSEAKGQLKYTAHDVSGRKANKAPRISKRRFLITKIPDSLTASAPDKVYQKDDLLIPFRILDKENDQPVAGATVSFVSVNSDKRFRFIADEQGDVFAVGLPRSEEYTMEVSCIGYTRYDSLYSIDNITEPIIITLSRELKENPEAVVIGYGSIRSRLFLRCGFSVNMRRIDSLIEETKQISSVHMYPNPVVRGGAITMESDLQTGSIIRVRIVSLAGNVLRSGTYSAINGLNRISIQTASHWSAGMYFLQIIDESGKILQLQKLIIQ